MTDFQAIAEGTVRLHRLMRSNEDDSPLADAIRDELDAPWFRLNEAEKERIQWLSEDLYSIDNDSECNSVVTPDPEVIRLLNDAKERSDWEECLQILRREAGRLSRADIAHERGVVWLKLGEQAVAAEFFAFAERLTSNNDNQSAIADTNGAVTKSATLVAKND